MATYQHDSQVDRDNCDKKVLRIKKNTENIRRNDFKMEIFCQLKYLLQRKKV